MVPENRATPNGRTIRLAVAIIPAATQPAQPDPVVFMTGGPGAAAIHDIYERGAAYNMPRGSCDGQDVHAVRAAVQEAIDRARADGTPTLLEVRTYRFMGHSMSDAVSGTYRSKQELDEHMKRDPIVLLRVQMQEAGEITDEQIAQLDEELKAEVQDAWDFADQSPEPPLEALWQDVLVDTTSDDYQGAQA